MELQNQDRFNDVVSRIFEALSNAFPLPVDIDAKSLGFTTGDAYKVVNHVQIPSDAMEAYVFVSSCVQWLEAADYLSTSKNYPATSKNVVLTEKGLQLISTSPMSLLRGNYS